MNKFHWIPNRILHCIYVNDRTVDALLEKVLLQYIFNMHDSNDTRRSERILQLLRICDEKARDAVFAIFKRQKQMSKMTEYFLMFLDKYNGGVIDGEDDEKVTSALHSIIQKISQQIPEQAKFEAYLQRLADKNDRHGYKLLKEVFNPMNDIWTVFKNMVII